MIRLVSSLAVALPALLLAAPAIAGDLSASGFGGDSGNFFGNTDDLRSGFPETLDNSDAYDPLSFELGLRYWYSWGAQNFNVGSSGVSETDNTHAAEAYFRVDDHSTGFYAKGIGGVDFKINGSATGSGASTSITDGHIAYAGADLGYSWLGDPRTGTTFGPFAGYMYWNDSPNMGRAPFTVGTQTSNFSGSGVNVVGPMDSKENNIEVNALRLGFSGQANLGNFFDVSGELAAVPYANISGLLGAFGASSRISGSDVLIQSSATDINGWGYGAMGELMVGYHPTSNLTFRVGGRAWYLQGRADSSYDTVAVSTDGTHTVDGQQRYISTSNPWSLFRYGLLTEMTYNF